MPSAWRSTREIDSTSVRGRTKRKMAAAFCSSAGTRAFLIRRQAASCTLQRSSFLARGATARTPLRRQAVAAIITMEKEEGTSVGLRVVAGVMAAGLVIGSLMPVFSGARLALNGDAGSAVVTEKLRKVPLFAVTDDTGRPFMSESPDGRRRVGYFFVTPADAESYLARVREITSPEEAASARVQPVSLDEALPFVNRKGAARGSVPETFEIVADEGETGIARQLTGGEFERVYGKGVPLFFVDSLALTGSGLDGPVTPLFFEKEKLDEYVEQAQSNGGEDIKKEDVQIVDLMQTVREMKGGNTERLRRIVLFPMERALMPAADGSFVRAPAMTEAPAATEAKAK